MDSRPKVFVHIVTFNSENVIERALDTLIDQVDYVVGKDLFIQITDNASTDKTKEILEKRAVEGISIALNNKNLGFAAAHNQGATVFLNSACKYFFIYNPDLFIDKNCIITFVRAAESSDENTGAFGGKLYRDLNPTEKILDSTGIIFDNSLRHYDRGAEEKDVGQYDNQTNLQGVTGACLFLKRKYVEDVSFVSKYDDDKFIVYPFLDTGLPRVPLFDEGFFSYREDADLAWRGKILGWNYLYVPTAIAYHIRLVTPERRKKLPTIINRASVKNRFLLQINNFSWKKDAKCILRGLILRNLVVFFGVIFTELSSLGAFSELFKLSRRAKYRRAELTRRSKDRKYESLFQ